MQRPPWLGVLEVPREPAADPVSGPGDHPPGQAQDHRRERDHEGPKHEIDHRSLLISTVLRRRAHALPRSGSPGPRSLSPRDLPRRIAADPFIIFPEGGWAKSRNRD